MEVQVTQEMRNVSIGTAPGPPVPQKNPPRPSRPRWPGLGSLDKGAPGQPQGVPGAAGHPQPRLHCVPQAWAAVTSGLTFRTSSTPPQSWTWAGSLAWTARAAGACWAQSPCRGRCPQGRCLQLLGRETPGVLTQHLPLLPLCPHRVPHARSGGAGVGSPAGRLMPGLAALPAHWPPSPCVFAARPRES